MVEHRTLVLVHSPLVGPLTWDSTAECLRRGGHRVVVAPLVGVTDDDPPYYRKLAEAAASAATATEEDGRVVLVGHSGAGALLPAIAEAAGTHVLGTVFVDAILPHPGRSWLDTAPPQLRDQLTGLAHADRLPRWNEWFPSDVLATLVPDPDTRERFVAELPRLPLAYFEEPAPTVHSAPTLRCAYVRLSEPYDPAADDAERRGWWVHRENADHLAPLTQPERTADLVARAATAAADR